MASIFARRRLRETDRRRAKRARTQPHCQDPKVPVAPPAAAGSPPVRPDWRDWANLTAGPAGMIAEIALSNGAAEHIRLRAVCTAWRAGTEDRFDPREWIMLPRTFGVVPDRRCFLDVRSGECIHVSLPLLRRRHTLGLTAEGLLVLCRNASPHAVQLLDPLSRQLVDLPDATKLATGPEGFQYRVISAGVAGDSTVVLRFGHSTRATAKPGDERWTMFHLGNRIKSTMAFAGRFYVATSVNILEVVTTTSRLPKLELAADYYQVDGGVYPDDLLRLVDNGGELLLAHRIQGMHGERRGHGRCKVYRVDLDQGKVVTMPRLGGRAVFLGSDSDRALAVPAVVSPAITADAVYICEGYDEETGQVKSVACHRLDGSIVEEGQTRKRPCSIVEHLSCYVAEK